MTEHGTAGRRPTERRYGTWSSPVDAELVAGRTVRLSALASDRGSLFWLEQRPAEGGRTVLVRRASDGTVADLTGTPIDVATRVHEYGGGAYAVRDGRIVLSDRTDNSLYVLDADGGAAAQPRCVASVPGCRFADFALSADRRHVFAVREDARSRPSNDPENTLVRIALDPRLPPERNDGVVVRRGPDFVASPRLSDAGDALAWLEWDHPDMPWDATRLMRAPLGADGDPAGPAVAVAGGAGVSIVQPEFEPDGALRYATDRSGWWNLERRRTDGETVPLCPAAAETGGPTWQLGFRFHDRLPDGRLLATVSSDGVVRAALVSDGVARFLPCGPVATCPVPLGDGRVGLILAPTDGPPAIALAAVDGPDDATPFVVRASAARILAADAVSIGEPIAFPVEGGTGHAFWYEPRNPDHVAPAGERPPLLVVSHGGPTAMATNTFSPAIQWWTSRGFGVVDVNYGGSSGFGRAWRRRLDGRWGIVDVADCVAAVRFLSARGVIDGARVAIRGGSAGGFTTLAALAGSDIFAVGASHYGVADLATLARDTHKFESRYLDRLVGPWPTARALYEARSPLGAAARIRCPVIFFQGLDDRVVPPAQARTMARAVVEAGGRAELHEFAGEGHGFRRQDTITEVLRLELAFFLDVLFGRASADAVG